MSEETRRLLLVGPGSVDPAVRDAVHAGARDPYTVHVASDATSGMASLADGGYAAILFDVSRPTTEAWSAFEKVQIVAAGHPVLAVARSYDGATATRALRAGAQDFLSGEALSPGSLGRAVEFAVERHRIVRERQASLDRLRELERFKTQFINTAAHELNSPLTPVRLQLHLLKSTLQPGMSERQKSSLGIVDRNVERLISLVRDILDAARLQADRLIVKKQRLDLYRVLQDAVESSREVAKAHGLTLRLESKPGIDVEADPDRIAQVVFNLLNNAMKFTPKGGQVRVVSEREGDNIVVRVHDTGIGLRPEDFGKLFQPFSQAYEWTQRRVPGSGLGLYISQGIVEQHGGRIWCDSEGPNRGATFSFAMPALREVSPLETLGSRAAPKVPRKLKAWPIIYFKCPTCGSRDINMRILKNKYECRACTDEWH